MSDTLIFLTQHYLNFASAQALHAISQHTRLVLIHYRGDGLPPTLEGAMATIHKVDGDLNTNVRPVLDYDACRQVVAEELQRLGGDPQRMRLFCQEECHVQMAARLRETFGIPGDQPKLVDKFRDKLLMKQAVAAYGVRIPQHGKLDIEQLREAPQHYFETLKTELGLPFVVKPVNAAGSFEVSIIHRLDQWLEARAQILASPFHFEYEVDEFIHGKMYQCDSLVVDGQVRFCGILELGCSNFDFVQGKPLSVFPVLTEPTRSILEDFNRLVINALGLKNGSTHHELFLDQATGEPVFLEIAARVPGGIGVPFHEQNSGINLIDANLYLSAGSELLHSLAPRHLNNVVSALLPLRKGRIVRLNDPQISSQFHINWRVEPGMTVDSRSLADTAGILTFSNDDQAALRRDFEYLQAYQPVEVENLQAQPAL